jgi:hypothetical protein
MAISPDPVLAMHCSLPLAMLSNLLVLLLLLTGPS